VLDVLHIKGGQPIQGVLPISGAKNAALPILAATLLINAPVSLKNLPHLQDVTTMISLLNLLGVRTLIDESMQLEFDARDVQCVEAPYDLVHTMRASFLVLGPLISRFRRARVALPGGCEIGTRPIDLHIKGLEQLGAHIEIKNGYVHATAPDGLKGTHIILDQPTVTGTENLMMAAVLAEGATTLSGGAKEPEVVDLANFLNACGAKITGAGTDEIQIQGVSTLQQPCHYDIMGDRIEAGTYLIAAAITSGALRLEGIEPNGLSKVLECLVQTGAVIETGADWIALDMKGQRPKAVSIETATFPGFPTDLQAQWLALNCVAEGEAVISETVFENRLMHVPALQSMGAQLSVSNQSVSSIGVDALSASEVYATDLRASASLILAGLVAQGETRIKNIYHVDRGYEYIESKFSSIGCRIWRTVEGPISPVRTSIEEV